MIYKSTHLYLTTFTDLCTLILEVQGFYISILVAASTLFSFGLTAQKGLQSNPVIHVKKTDESITIDGLFDESIWKSTIPAKNFLQNFPVDSLLATYDTEVHMAYDEQNLYVLIKCYASDNSFVIPSLRRDFGFFGNDNITILFDTYNDNTNAIVFGMNPYGARREAVISNSGQDFGDFDDSWDNKWDGAAHMQNDMWTAEMVIPFSTLRYTKGSTSWRFNCYRFDTQSNEVTTWMGIPQNRLVMDLAFMGEMIWEEPLESTGSNVSIIPYVSGSTSRDFEDITETGAVHNFSTGLDAKIGISSGLNLDLTVNPDFSQVEVDEQVTNLTRFEIFFPERRQFFLENADLFSDFGAGRINPFFSRRIGVSIDPSTGQNVQNAILYGARLSGKLNDRTRVGLLSTQTDSQQELGIPGFNYAVITADQRISDYSRLAFIGINRQAVDRGDLDSGFSSYNRVFGLEHRLNSPDNKWTGKFNLTKSFTPGVTASSYSHFAQYQYNTRKVRLEWAQLYVGGGFISETGFVPRKDFLLLSPEFSLNFYPDNPKVSQTTLSVDSRFFIKASDADQPFLDRGDLEEIGLEVDYDISFTNSAMMSLSLEASRFTLLNDFDPTRVQDDGIFLPAGEQYTSVNVGLDYQSDQRKVFTYAGGLSLGKFFDGDIYAVEGSLGYRYQPYGFISVDFEYNRLVLDDPFVPVDIWLVGPRIDLTFSKNVFLTTFVQFNSQFDNLNINTRFQWRFAPVSDFFVVYTDNYLTARGQNFSSRNRALVAKFTYWFNL